MTLALSCFVGRLTLVLQHGQLNRNSVQQAWLTWHPLFLASKGACGVRWGTTTVTSFQSPTSLLQEGANQFTCICHVMKSLWLVQTAAPILLGNVNKVFYCFNKQGPYKTFDPFTTKPSWKRQVWKIILQNREKMNSAKLRRVFSFSRLQFRNLLADSKVRTTLFSITNSITEKHYSTMTFHLHQHRHHDQRIPPSTTQWKFCFVRARQIADWLRSLNILLSLIQALTLLVKGSRIVLECIIGWKLLHT